MYEEKQKHGRVFMTRAEALLRNAQFRTKTNKNKRGGVVFYVNDELDCKEIKKACIKWDIWGLESC